MGRPSKLSEPMREEIGRRIAAGEPIRALAREFRVAESTLRENFSAQAPKIRKLATALASTELEVAELPVSAQRAVRDLANQLKAIQDDYATAAANGAKTSAHLSKLALHRAQQLDETAGLEDLVAVSALSRTANQALAPAATLIQANKAQDLGKSEEDSRATLIINGVASNA